MRHKIFSDQDILFWQGKKIPYFLRLSGRRTLQIRVISDGTVWVYAPRRARKNWIREQVQSRAAWIIRQLEKASALIPVGDPKSYQEGSLIMFLGESYRLVCLREALGPVRISGGSLILEDDGSSTAKNMDRWYRRQAKEIYSRYLADYYPNLEGKGISYPELKIRRMRRSWGICSPGGRITLNLHLVKLPLSCIEYVVAHELCHLVHRNHAREFYALLESWQPDWRSRRDTLNCYRID